DDGGPAVVVAKTLDVVVDPDPIPDPPPAPNTLKVVGLVTACTPPAAPFRACPGRAVVVWLARSCAIRSGRIFSNVGISVLSIIELMLTGPEPLEPLVRVSASLFARSRATLGSSFSGEVEFAAGTAYARSKEDATERSVGLFV